MTIIHQAAAIAYQLRENELFILLIKSRNGKKWIIPKGIIEDGDSARFTAEKETEEEAGVKGVIKNKICGLYEYNKWGGVCKVQVFSMQVTTIMDTWEEMDFRERKWEKSENALKMVKPKLLRKIIKNFIKSLNK